MKRLFSFIAILSLVSGVAYAYTDDGNASVKRAIAGAPASVAYREYQLVRYPNNLNLGSNTPLTAGDVVVWDCVSDDGITVNVVLASNSADAVAGVVVSPTIGSADTVGTTPATDFGRRNWGYIQVKGLCTNINTVGTLLAGGSIKASDTARNADDANVVGTHARVMGFSYDAGVDSEAYINL